MTDILTKAKEALKKAASFGDSSKEMPLRDITGHCEGECRDRVMEGEMERQHEIELSSAEDVESYPAADWAFSRNEPPGVYGGHV